MIWLFFFILAQQDEIVSENLDTVSVSMDFERSVSKYNSIDRDDSRPMFEDIVATLEAKPALGDEDQFILRESLKFLGVITYPAETRRYFEKLVRVDPGYNMGAQKLSPKIVKIFDDLKLEMVGQLRVGISDATEKSGLLLTDATLKIDGKFIGLLQGDTTFEVLAGAHKLEITKPNFDPYVKDIVVQANKTTTINGVVYRNSSELVFMTVPTGVKIFFDGVGQGTTQGSAPITYSDSLMRSGITPSQASDLFAVNGVAPGKYQLRFEKPCFKTKLIEVEVTQNERRTYQPVTMEPVYSFIDVATAAGDAAGIVYLNDERIGSLPIKAFQTCPGEFTLKVQFTDGQFIKHVVLEEGQTTRVSAEPLPSIVWFGVKEEGVQAPDENIDRWLKDLKSWNVSLVDPNNTRLVQHDPFDLLFNESRTASDSALSLDRSLNADLYVAARVVRRNVVIRYLEVAFWTPLSKKIRVYSIDFREIEKFKELMNSIDGPLPLTHSWIGARTAKVLAVNGVKVLEVSPSGPLAGLAVNGDLITSIDGKLINHPAQLMSLVAGKATNVEINGTSVSVVPLETIAELPYDPASLCPQAVVARLEKLGKYASSPLIKQSATFNRARYQFFLGDFKQAFDTFSDAKFRLDYDYGINQGSLYFYQGLCFRRLDLNAEARNAFGEASKYPEGTLFDAYGPKVAFWAEAQIQQL